MAYCPNCGNVVVSGARECMRCNVLFGPDSETDWQPSETKPEVVVADAAAQDQPAFFPVGLLKLSLMSVVTFGFYQFYWFNQNWKSARRLSGESLNHVVRAMFYPVTSYFLFQRIQEQGRRLGVNVSLQAAGLSAALFVLTALWRLPDPLWLVVFLAFLPLLPVQVAVNEINLKVAPGADPNRRFSAWNMVALVIGGAFLGLVIFGLLLGKPESS